MLVGRALPVIRRPLGHRRVYRRVPNLHKPLCEHKTNPRWDEWREALLMMWRWDERTGGVWRGRRRKSKRAAKNGNLKGRYDWRKRQGGCGVGQRASRHFVPQGMLTMRQIVRHRKRRTVSQFAHQSLEERSPRKLLQENLDRNNVTYRRRNAQLRCVKQKHPGAMK